VPYVGVDFAVYETMKRSYLASADASKMPPLVTLGIGAVAGLAAQTVSYPLDLVRRRLQVQGFSATPHNYTGMVDGFVKILSTDGMYF
jgi:solute carrier family 25 (mitochondrial phosphate transporter), member 23/24/25/41